MVVECLETAPRQSHGRDRRRRQPCDTSFNSLANSATYLLSVASTEFNSKNRQLASVNTPTQIEQTRIGLFDLRAELKTLRDRGWSNLCQF